MRRTRNPQPTCRRPDPPRTAPHRPPDQALRPGRRRRRITLEAGWSRPRCSAWVPHSDWGPSCRTCAAGADDPLITAISRICPAPMALKAPAGGQPEGDIQLRTIGESGTSAEPGWLQLPGRTQPVIISPAVQESGVTGGSLLSSDRQLVGRLPGPTGRPVCGARGANADLLIINSESPTCWSASR